MEPIPYCLCRSNSYPDSPIVSLSEIGSFQLSFETVFDVVFRSLEVVSV